MSSLSQYIHSSSEVNKFNGTSKQYGNVDRQTYTRTVGQLRQDLVTKALRELLPSYTVRTNNVNANGTDVTVTDGYRIIAKFEVMNEKYTSYFKAKKCSSLYRNLEGVPYHGVICSFGNFIDSDDGTLPSENVLTLGYQTLPKDYHDIFIKYKDVYKRKVDSANTFQQLKKQLRLFLNRIRLKDASKGNKVNNHLVAHVCSIDNNITSTSPNNNIRDRYFISSKILVVCAAQINDIKRYLHNLGCYSNGIMSLKNKIKGAFDKMKYKAKLLLMSRDGKEWVVSRLDYVSCDSNLETGQLNENEEMLFIDGREIGVDRGSEFVLEVNKIMGKGRGNGHKSHSGYGKDCKCSSCGQLFKGSSVLDSMCKDCFKVFQEFKDSLSLNEEDKDLVRVKGESIHD